VDFVTVIDGKVTELIEVKLSDTKISSSLKYYQQKLNPERTVQIVGELKRSYDHQGIRVTNAIEHFSSPPWKQPSL
jgi:hypothetical protein